MVSWGVKGRSYTSLNQNRHFRSLGREEAVNEMCYAKFPAPLWHISNVTGAF